MESAYILRIYRRDASGPTGLLEDPASGRREPFHGLADLGRALEVAAKSNAADSSSGVDRNDKTDDSNEAQGGFNEV